MSPRFYSFFNWLLLAAALTMASSASASTLTVYIATYSGISTSQQSSAASACSKLKGLGGLFPNYTAAGASGTGGGGACIWRTSSDTLVYYGTWSMSSANCPYGDNGIECNVSCPAPNVMSGGQCVAPPPPPPTCTGDSVLNPATNSCDLTCAAPKIPDPATMTCVTPTPSCGAGQHYDFDEKRCVYPEDDNCPPGAAYDPAIQKCSCPTGSQLSQFGTTATCLPVGDQSDCSSSSADFMGYSQNPATLGKPLCSGRGRCPDGSKPGYIGAGSDVKLVCAPETGKTPGCSGYVGNVNGQDVCLEDPKNDSRCKPGETSGSMGSGENMTHVCIPADFLPKTCPPGQYAYQEGPDGGFACVTNSTTEPPKKNPDGSDKPAGSVSGTGSSTTKDADGNVVETEESELELDFSDLIENAPNDNFKKDLDDFAGKELSDAVDEKDLLSEFAGSDGAFTGRDKLDNAASFVQSHTIGNSTSCSGNLPFMGYVVSCDRFAMYNRIMGWFFFVLTIFRIRDCLMRPSASGV